MLDRPDSLCSPSHSGARHQLSSVDHVPSAGRIGEAQSPIRNSVRHLVEFSRAFGGDFSKAKDVTQNGSGL